MLMTGARIVVPLAVLVPTFNVGFTVIVFFLFWTMFTEISHHSTHFLAKVFSLGWIPGRCYPGHHLEHHLHPQYNYGENWIFWDKLMGTTSPSVKLDCVDSRGNQQSSDNAGKREVTVEAGADDVGNNIHRPIQLSHNQTGVAVTNQLAQEKTGAEC